MQKAPDWDVVEWLNAPKPVTQESLNGKVVVLGAFQLLCPGCVAEAIPQWRNVNALFTSDDVAMIGLHTVFEHHDGMGVATLKAFLHENRIAFPVGVDRAQLPKKLIPATMEGYGMQGTPTTILIDRQGMLRRQIFGHVPDLQLGAEIMALVCEAK